VAAFCEFKVITSIGNIPLLYVPKHHISFATFFSGMNIPGILWLRTKNSEQMMQINNTSRNNTSDMIILLMWAIFWDQKK
jgi:hypothetical protein